MSENGCNKETGTHYFLMRLGLGLHMTGPSSQDSHQIEQEDPNLIYSVGIIKV